ncbi:hypothetical protein ACA910_004821 [Epithemia clementina (nom. ined.)]
MFGDASGAGFETSLWLQGANTIQAEHRVWTCTYGAKSSNFRELYDLVARMEALVHSNELETGTEVFVFTDNSTAEAAFDKGTSKSKLLFDRVLRLRSLEMHGQIFVHVIWVAGTRMVEQGTDGLSRGDLMHGVLAGANMLEFVSLNKTIRSQHPYLADFLAEPMLGLFTPIFLDPDGWYSTAFKPGHYVWTPPPAAALEALEQLCDSKHVRPQGAHLFACPALMTNRWRKKLGRIADVVLTVTVGSFAWQSCHHEPVIVGLIFPFLNCRP